MKKMVEIIKIMEIFDSTNNILNYNMKEFKDKYPKIFSMEDVNFFIGFDNIPPEPNKNYLNFDIFCWYEIPTTNFILREFSKMLKRTNFDKQLNEFLEKHVNIFGQTKFISDLPKETMLEEIRIGIPNWSINWDEEEENNILNCCLSGVEEVKSLFDEMKSIDLKKIEPIFSEFEALLNRIEVIDETEILSKHSNSGRDKTIIFRTQKDKYKLHIHAESYDFQSYVTLYIWSNVNKKWHEIRMTNPIKEHGLNFRISDSGWDGTNFDSIIWNYIKFLDKFEE